MMSRRLNRTLRALGLAHSPSASPLAARLAAVCAASQLDTPPQDVGCVVVTGPDLSGLAGAARALWPRAEVHLMTPMREQASRLARDEARRTRATVHALALGDRSASLGLFTPRLGSGRFVECAASDADVARAALGDPGPLFFSVAEAACEEDAVPMRPLDAMGLGADVVIASGPLDVYRLVMGAVGVLTRRRALIVASHWDARVQTTLADLGYAWREVDGVTVAHIAATTGLAATSGLAAPSDPTSEPELEPAGASPAPDTLPRSA